MGNGVDHGIDTSNVYFQVWFAGVPLLYFALVVIFRVLGYWSDKARFGSRLSDILAFEVVAGLCVTYLGIAGLVIYFSLFGVDEYDKLSANKFDARSEFMENHMIYPMISYQGWNLLLCILSHKCFGITGTDLCDVFMIGHHAVTGALAYFGLHPYLHFYGIFYFGVAELTNIPLTIMDFFKYFKEYANKYSALNNIVRTTFGASFIVLRLVVWPVYSYPFWQGSLNRLLHSNPPAHSPFVVGFFLLANVFLTALQFMWGKTIINNILGFNPEKKTPKAVPAEKKVE